MRRPRVKRAKLVNLGAIHILEGYAYACSDWIEALTGNVQVQDRQAKARLRLPYLSLLAGLRLDHKTGQAS